MPNVRVETPDVKHDEISDIARRVLEDLEEFFDSHERHEQDDDVVEMDAMLSLDELTVIIDASIRRHGPPMTPLPTTEQLGMDARKLDDTRPPASTGPTIPRLERHHRTGGTSFTGQPLEGTPLAEYRALLEAKQRRFAQAKAEEALQHQDELHSRPTGYTSQANRRRLDDARSRFSGDESRSSPVSSTSSRMSKTSSQTTSSPQTLHRSLRWPPSQSSNPVRRPMTTTTTSAQQTHNDDGRSNEEAPGERLKAEKSCGPAQGDLGPMLWDLPVVPTCSPAHSTGRNDHCKADNDLTDGEAKREQRHQNISLRSGRQRLVPQARLQRSPSSVSSRSSSSRSSSSSSADSTSQAHSEQSYEEQGFQRRDSLPRGRPRENNENGERDLTQVGVTSQLLHQVRSGARYMALVSLLFSVLIVIV